MDVYVFVLECRLTSQQEQANADGVERGGGGVALSQGTNTVDLLFDFHDLPGGKGADSIRQSVNMHIYECPIQSVAHTLLPYISVCLQTPVL